jgi:integrase
VRQHPLAYPRPTRGLPAVRCASRRCGPSKAPGIEKRLNPSKRDAERALRAALKAVDDGEHADPDRITLSDYLADVWLPQVRASGRKPTTVSLYEMVATKYIGDHVGKTRLQRVTGSTIAGLYADLRTRGRTNTKHPGGLGENMMHTVHVVLRQALADAVAQRLIARNPCDDLPKNHARKPHRDMTTWSGEEVAVFLGATRDKRLHPLWFTLALTGLRRGEACGLRWSDLDLEAGRAHIQNTLVMVGTQVQAQPPKTSRARRGVSLPPELCAALKAWHTEQKQQRLRAGDAWVTGDYVFTWEDGRPYRPDYVTNEFGKAHGAVQYEAVEDGKKVTKHLPAIRLHDLRQGFASLALQRGIHPKVVGEQLGHSSITVTIDTYSHVIPQLQEEAVGKVAEAVFGASR